MERLFFLETSLSHKKRFLACPTPFSWPIFHSLMYKSLPSLHSSCTLLHFPKHTKKEKSLIPLQARSLVPVPAISNSLPMFPELEKPRVTEIQVRIDCNGCVQKIKKALHGIKGIYNFYINTQQQKLTVVGWADPEIIIKAIKKTRKLATICAHSEVSEPQPPNPPPPAEGAPPAPDPGNPPPTETPPADPAPPAEAPKEQPPQPQPENPPQEATPPPPAPTDNAAATPPSGEGPSEAKDVEEIHVIHHHPRQYGYNDYWNSYTNGYGFRPEGPHYGLRPEGPPYITTHNYNNYRPSPHISAYVTEYGYPRSPPQNVQYEYRRPEHYSDDYDDQTRSGNGNGNNITSFFSDENPNACRIV